LKKITTRNLIGQRGINLIEECVLSMGFAWHPTNQAVEAGIDGYIELRNPDTEQALNLVVAVQSKARTDFAGESPDSFTFYCEQRDVDYWLQGNVPVVLVVSRPDTREAFWCNVKEYFAVHPAQNTKKIVFDKIRDRFDPGSRDRLFALARPKDSGLYLAPLPKTEHLFPNLLQVVLPTSHICFANTNYRERRQVSSAFHAQRTYPPTDWLLWGGQIISFQRLDQGIWPLVCDKSSMTQRRTEELADSEDEDQCRLLVSFLTRCLEAKLRDRDILFDDQRDTFYFSDTDRLTTKTISFKSSTRQSYRTVFEAYRDKETQKVRFCRHFAFQAHFRRLEGVWQLEVTPTYRFTRDGRKPDRFGEERLKGIKRLERNRAVLGQLLTWIDILTPSAGLFNEAYPHLYFEPPTNMALDVGINDDGWFAGEEPDEAAKLNTDEAAAKLLF
jgi:hypothetical protein